MGANRVIPLLLTRVSPRKGLHLLVQEVGTGASHYVNHVIPLSHSAKASPRKGLHLLIQEVGTEPLHYVNRVIPFSPLHMKITARTLYRALLAPKKHLLH